MPEYAPQIIEISRLEKRTCSVDCQGNLDGDAVITGIPTIVERSSAHLTIADIQVSTTELTIAGKTVPAGKAIQFSVDARGVSVRYRKTYRLQIEFDTDTGDHVAGGVRLEAV